MIYMNEETIIENEILVYKDHYCNCPCHKRISWNRCHKWNGTPKYIKFHQRRGIKQSFKEIEKRVLKNTGKKRTPEQKERMRKEQADILKAKQSTQRKCSLEKRKQMSITITNAILEGKLKQNTNHLNGHYFSIKNNKKFWFRSSYELMSYKL